MHKDDLADPADIRGLFSSAMSEMYRREVPLYSTLLGIVADVNRAALDADPMLRQRLEGGDELGRLAVERHGAIRLGTAAELEMIARVFRVMGMVPVGYYDLSAAGLPVHATAFRPVDEASLRRNPFRVFTSLLRLDQVSDSDLRQGAADILARRDIFGPSLRRWLDRHDCQDGLSRHEAELFVADALEIFRWHSTATVSAATYQSMSHAHRLLADVVCFRGPHINHLTPRTLDIDAAQQQMPGRGMAAKPVIEGPPSRACPILLRQTSFKALEEQIHFPTSDGAAQPGCHTARFGEIEQRGVALTLRGRALYDTLLTQSRAAAAGVNSGDYAAILARCFEAFPDNERELRQQRLAFFRWHATPQAPKAGLPPGNAWTADALVAAGWIRFEPVIYEDFLPVSAAGIFHSNLGHDTTTGAGAGGRRAEFEGALGGCILDELDIYQGQVRRSHETCMSFFGLPATPETEL